jgi:GTPase
VPVNQNNAKAVSHAGSAVAAGIADMKPADPVEGMLISQLVVANEAALKLYQLAWRNNAEYFEASTKYLQLADRASRTVAMLTERLDHHRNRGQQQIVVQHTTTVNANQAVVTDSVVTGKKNEAAPSAKLLAAVTDQPIEIIEAEIQKEAVPGGRDTKPK